MKCKDNRDDQPSKPSAGIYPHPKKQVGHEKGTLANPSAGLQDTCKDPKNAAKPNAGVADERKDQKKFDETHDEHKRKRL
jgi:hypothetical protein